MGWVGLGQGLFRTRSLSVSARVSGTKVPRNSRLSGLKAYRTVDRPRTPRWHMREGDAAVEACVARARGQGGGGGGLLSRYTPGPAAVRLVVLGWCGYVPWGAVPGALDGG